MESWVWLDRRNELDLLGGLEDPGWCLAYGVYRHMVFIYPFQEEEEEEPAQERKVRRRRGKGRLQQQQQQHPQQQQEEVGDDDCGEYGHMLAICPMQYEEEELVPK
ncbi:UNVERIFIED_CONTAM: hypothetical protein FKN15_072078 [Acipenser sinensis]